MYESDKYTCETLFGCSKVSIADIAIAEGNSCEHFFKKSEMFF